MKIEEKTMKKFFCSPSKFSFERVFSSYTLKHAYAISHTHNILGWDFLRSVSTLQQAAGVHTWRVCCFHFVVFFSSIYIYIAAIFDAHSKFKIGSHRSPTFRSLLFFLLLCFAQRFFFGRSHAPTIPFYFSFFPLVLVFECRRRWCVLKLAGTFSQRTFLMRYSLYSGHFQRNVSPFERNTLNDDKMLAHVIWWFYFASFAFYSVMKM